VIKRRILHLIETQADVEKIKAGTPDVASLQKGDQLQEFLRLTYTPTDFQGDQAGLHEI
jgi:hypothetical protein